MNKDVMNQGVQILLDRMDTNPEEFADGGEGKWADITGAIHARVMEKKEGKDYGKPLPFLTDPEVEALYEKLEDARRENFTADVLRRLANAPQELEQRELWANTSRTTYSTTNLPLVGTPMTGATGTTLTTSFPNTTVTGKISLSQADVASLTTQQKAELVKALDEYRNQRHEELHKQLELSVKAQRKKLAKAVK